MYRLKVKHLLFSIFVIGMAIWNYKFLPTVTNEKLNDGGLTGGLLAFTIVIDVVALIPLLTEVFWIISEYWEKPIFKKK